jgi:hypothetical protein
MKTVYTNSNDVMHLFAQRTQNNARTNSAFFEGNKVYSYGYHYLLGEFIENKKGLQAIMINNTGYSVTTSKQISELTGATRQYKQFFKTECNIELVHDQIKGNFQKLVSARKKELYILPCQRLFEKLNEFLIWDNNKTFKKNVYYKAIIKIMNVINGGDLVNYLEKEKIRIAKEAKKADLKKAKEASEKISKFENFEIDRIHGLNEDFVRISKDNETIETSQGVSVPLKEAKVLYSLIAAKKDIKGFKISNYTVISINGVLTIGCHRININSLHKVGAKLL